ncbi:hypothetical protein DFS33DRAFT_1379607 [Desarmillaria ectypa]|nr:hypothetical protein DFS33DRAFT_1379607 [Desarmillaria ectypa]
MFHCDPKAYVWFLLLASHITLVVSAAPVKGYTERLADDTVKTIKKRTANDGNSASVSGLPGLLPALTTPSSAIPSSTFGNNEIPSLLKEVAQLAPGTTVVNVNAGDESSLLSDATGGAINPSGGATESGVATGDFGDTASGGDDVSTLDGTGGVDGFDDDTTMPGVPIAVEDDSPASTSNLGPGIADDDDGTDTTNSDSLVNSTIQDGTKSWKGVNESHPATGSDSLDPGSGIANGTVGATIGSNSTAGVGDSSNPPDGTSHAAGGPPTNRTSILKISIENTQKINIDKGVVTS